MRPAQTARQLLVEVLLKIGMKSAGLADGLDLDFDGISVDDGGRLILPQGFINHVKRQHPHWFKQRRRAYRDPDTLRGALHPEFQLPPS